MKTHQKGFTLIELLVVVSIIAMLSSVVISALNAARARAADNSVKAAMKQMHSQAENYLDSNTTLGQGIGVCTAGVFADSQFSAIRANALSNAASGATMSCATDSSGSRWAVSVSALRGGGAWCTDNSQGWFKAGAVNTATGQCQ